MRHLSPIISLVLIPLVAVLPLRAEFPGATTPAPAKASATETGPTTPGQSNTLKIRLADESKAVVEANSWVKGYAILVTDSAGLPVPDAAVAIRLPEDGATGFFVNGEHSAVAYTDSTGVAKFPQVNWAGTPGSVSVRVTAVKGELHAGALIEHTVIAQTATPPTPAAATPENPTPAKAATTPATTPIPQSSPAPASTPAPNNESATNKRPGVPVTIATVQSGATPDPNAITTQTAASAEPAVSVVNTGSSKASNGNTRKWVIIAAVVAAAGIGAAVALSAKGGAAAAAAPASTATSIGTPTVSLGH